MTSEQGYVTECLQSYQREMKGPQSSLLSTARGHGGVTPGAGTPSPTDFSSAQCDVTLFTYLHHEEGPSVCFGLVIFTLTVLHAGRL